MKVVHVAVAVIENAAGEYLIAHRAAHQHMGGYWEFPGGKVEAGETVFHALQREISEEVALIIHDAQPMLRIPFSYPDKRVLLDVWRVTAFSGVAHGRENQPLRWVLQKDLCHYTFPPANQAILTAVQLPERLLITGAFQDQQDCLQRTQRAIEKTNIHAVMLRAHQLDTKNFLALAQAMADLCHAYGAKLLLNTAVNTALGNADGLHLSSSRLMACGERPVSQGALLGASCHNRAEIAHAVALGVNYVCVSPVLPTQSHPNEPELGWEGLATVMADCPLPVFALGGLGDEHAPQAKQLGVYGIAAISSWW